MQGGSRVFLILGWKDLFEGRDNEGQILLDGSPDRPREHCVGVQIHPSSTFDERDRFLSRPKHVA